MPSCNGPAPALPWPLRIVLSFPGQPLVSEYRQLIAAIAHDAAKAYVAGRGIDRMTLARGGPVTLAIVRRTKMRTALQHTPGNPIARETRVEAALAVVVARIARHTAALLRVGGVTRRIEILRPFPDISDHIEQAVAIGGEAAHRRGVLDRKSVV